MELDKKQIELQGNLITMEIWTMTLAFNYKIKINKWIIQYNIIILQLVIKQFQQQRNIGTSSFKS